jgi:O-antigen ligase
LFSIYDIVILVLGGAGVFLTFSISGVILYVSLLFSYTFYTLFTRGLGKTLVKYAFIVVCLSVMLLIAFSDLRDIAPMSKLRKSERARIFFEDPTEFHQSRAFAARMDLVKQSLRLIGERPFLGWGSGYFFSMPTSPHNMYLARGIDNGIVGFIAYVALVVSLFQVNRRRGNIEGVMLTFVFALAGFFTHNLLEIKPLWLALGISTSNAFGRQSLRVLQGQRPPT